MVLDAESTNPPGWKFDRDPHEQCAVTDAVIYELHIRDISMDPDSGIRHKGKFLGLTEHGTVNSGGIPTGLDHIRDLGFTHVHLLPCFDFGSVDERKDGGFNWGYDPVNFNVPEGSYSTDPGRGEVRVSEMKQMVKALHDSGISVVMDVVYNHVFRREDFCVNRIVPDYFSRKNPDGTDSNGSGCGNDTASERPMVRKYIVDSVNYWADEYHIDGFRFDLVGLLDVDTVNEIVRTVHAKHPGAIFYGEGWSMPTSTAVPDCTMATQYNAALTPGFAYFSDTIRDGLRGTVFDNNAVGFLSGAQGLEPVIRDSFAGKPNWSPGPAQTVNYASCHDNMTLFDRLTRSTPGETRENRIRMNNLSGAICLLSQGIPFFQAGEEMLRSKPLEDGDFDSNSYRSPDSVNSIKWENLNRPEYQQVYAYYRGLIAFRKAHKCLRLTDSSHVSRHLAAEKELPAEVLAFQIMGEERPERLFVVFNAGHEPVELRLPEGIWTQEISDIRAGTEPLAVCTGNVQIPEISAAVFLKKLYGREAAVYPRR